MIVECIEIGGALFLGVHFVLLLYPKRSWMCSCPKFIFDFASTREALVPSLEAQALELQLGLVFLSLRCTLCWHVVRTFGIADFFGHASG